MFFNNDKSFAFNTAYHVFLGDNLGKHDYMKFHNDDFCVENKAGKIRLVKIKKVDKSNSNIYAVCSDKAWQPYEPSFWKRMFN